MCEFLFANDLCFNKILSIFNQPTQTSGLNNHITIFYKIKTDLMIFQQNTY